MNKYLDAIAEIAQHGRVKTDRTGTGTKSIFGMQMRFDLSKGFPLVTTKKVPLRLVLIELLWFLSGSTNNHELVAQDCHIWDEWASTDGELGPIYGKQWRDWGGRDQIVDLVNSLRHNPDSRRHIVSAWNVAELHKMALAPCHCLFQFDVTDDRLSCQLYQRSCDMFLGVPFNIASYAALTHMLAQQVGLEVGDFIWTGGDCHLYSNHMEQVGLQLSRKPRELPKLVIKRKPATIFDYKVEDFELIGYDPHPSIKAPVAV